MSVRRRSKATSPSRAVQEGCRRRQEQVRGPAEHRSRRSSKIRDDARAEASHIIADARSRAESDAAQITANAQRSIESQQQQALVSLKGEVGTLATALAGKILGAKLESDDVQSSMIDKMIDDLDTNDKK